MLTDRRDGWNTAGSSEDLPGDGRRECGGSAELIGTIATTKTRQATRYSKI